MLDFDGTLAPIVPEPEDAYPWPGVAEVLADLVGRARAGRHRDRAARVVRPRCARCPEARGGRPLRAGRRRPAGTRRLGGVAIARRDRGRRRGSKTRASASRCTCAARRIPRPRPPASAAGRARSRHAARARHRSRASGSSSSRRPAPRKGGAVRQLLDRVAAGGGDVRGRRPRGRRSVRGPRRARRGRDRAGSPSPASETPEELLAPPISSCEGPAGLLELLARPCEVIPAADVEVA